MTRRDFLRAGGASLLVAACAPGLGAVRPPRAFRASENGSAGESGDGRGRSDAPLLVVIFLRGGADGLHLVPPVSDPGYARLRGALALRETLSFADGFGLHPALAPARELVARGQLAAVHACGSPHPTRSHFEAQDFMEVGEPGAARRHDGWLARALRGRAEPDPFATLALASELPLSLRGTGSFAIGDADGFGLPGASDAAREALASLYAGGARAAGDAPLRGAVGDAGSRALAALAEYERRLGRPAGRGRGFGRPRRPTLARSAEQLLALERAGLGVRAVFLESSGWDTHVHQGGASGAFANAAGDLAAALAALDAGLGERRDWLAVVTTEFGRTVRPNGGAGSDHGHGSVALVAGPRVRGGVYGGWPGLAERALHEGRDLPVATDWRHVLHEVVRAHLGAAPPADTFPGFRPTPLGLLA